MNVKQLALGMGLAVLALQTQAWNSLGHRLVAQIAYDNLSPEARDLFNRYNRYIDNQGSKQGPRTLVASASWLDTLRQPDQLWMQSMHYINIPFSRDNTPLQPPKDVNAVVSIDQARQILESGRAGNYEKGFNLRVLLHVVGDIHQPMHAVSLYSARTRNGDKGGNLYRLRYNPVADNLHAYWDRGGGLLLRDKPYSISMFRRRAKLIEKRWPCDARQLNLSPQAWAEESFHTAVNQAYQLNYGQKPSRVYQKQVKQISEQRLALAGCRLAALLNHIALVIEG
ncbi:S1/P1 nuclease [Legionella sp. CNM-4043-24]|uniref:S1/P1 nuclease n=1 Tax=Legionella sp. CNM-4043-24 TaxID=3421646 RepID=UPI00403AA7B4